MALGDGDDDPDRSIPRRSPVTIARPPKPVRVWVACEPSTFGTTKRPAIAK
jgi:hypothetical protein